MKSQFTVIILILITLSSFGQITFEKGYFIDNNNHRVECLIKNNDWKDNPKEFVYKLTEGAGSAEGELSKVKEFGITGSSRFVRADVKMDASPMGTSDLSKQREPEWSQEQLFLKVLVKGKATLYYFEGGTTSRFFYSLVDSTIKQLIYKEYYANIDEIATNFKFREQLWTEVRCATASTNVIEQLNYRKTDLEKYFKKYNECNGSISIDYKIKKTTKWLHIKVSPGINYSTFSVANMDDISENTEFAPQIGLRLGLETELILPFNKNKWGIIFEPCYQYFNDTNDNPQGFTDIKIQSIEFPIGLRHYFFLNPKLSLFIDGIFIPFLSPDFQSKMGYYDIRSRNSFAYGGGISTKKLSAEVRFYTTRDMFDDFIFLRNNYRRVSVIFGYKIL